MNENDPAYKLAAAAAKLGSDHDALDREIAWLKPTARDIARAYERAFYAPFDGQEAFRFALRARLDAALVDEHVAAQRKMGRTISRLTWALVGLTAALVYFATFDYLNHRSTGRSSDSAAWARWAESWERTSSPAQLSQAAPSATEPAGAHR